MLMSCACCCAFVVAMWHNVALIMYVIDSVVAEHERGPPSRHQRKHAVVGASKSKSKDKGAESSEASRSCLLSRPLNAQIAQQHLCPIASQASSV